MAYAARAVDGQIFLRDTEQMDKYLANGCFIFDIDVTTGKETLIATPKDGYLVEKPIFPEVQTMKI